MHRPYTYLFQTPNQSPISRENEVQRFDGFKDGPIELRYTEIRSINDDLIWSFLTGRKFTYSQSYIDRLKEKKNKKKVRNKDRSKKILRSKRNTVLREQTGRRSFFEEVRRISHGSRVCSSFAGIEACVKDCCQTSRRESVYPFACIGAWRNQMPDPAGEDRVFRMLPANGRFCTRFTGTSVAFSDVSVSEWNHRLGPAWKHGRWRRNLSVSFDLLCIDQQRSIDILESCIADTINF